MKPLPISLRFQIFFIFIQVLKTHSSSCFTYLISEVATPSTCDSPLSFPTATTPLNIPSSPSKILALSLTILPISLCPAASERLLLTVSIIPPGTTTRKRIIIMKFAASTSNALFINSQDNTGEKNLFSHSVLNYLGVPATIHMVIDLAGNSKPQVSVLIANVFSTFTSSTTVTYGSDWVFDSSTVISLCSNYDGTPGTSCIVQNLKLMYEKPLQPTIMPFGNINSLIADYKFNENQGTSLQNSQQGSGALGPASLSSSPSPTWTSDSSGLQFNGDVNEYIQLPSVIPAGQDMSITSSIGFAFWIKINQAPTTDIEILTYYCNSISAQIFRLVLTSSLKFQIALISGNMQPTQPITQGQWTLLYTSFVFTAGGYARAQLTMDEAMISSGPSITSVPSALAFSNLDVLKIGGAFTGQIRRLQIYSPAALGSVAGSNYLCDSSSCFVEIGFSNPPDCLKPTCNNEDGLYPSYYGTCEPCPSGCKTCADFDTCQVCDSGKYLVGTTCVECPKGKYVASETTCLNCPPSCSSCTDTQTCTSCTSDYYLSGGLCRSCPIGTYPTSDQICKELPQALQDTLTNSQLINSGASQIASLISKGSSISLSAAVSGRVFSQIKYLNISYSGELQVALLTWLPSFVSLGLTPDMPEFMKEAIPERHVPYVFEKYEVLSSFLINFWESLGVVVFLIILWSFLKGFELMIDPQKNPRPVSFARRLRVLIQNFLISATFGVYGDLVMFSIVEYRTFKIGWNLSLLSFIISIILLIAMVICFYIQIRLLLTYQKIKKQDQRAPNNSRKKLDKFIKNHEGSQVLFKDYKDYSLAPQLFFFFLSGRDLIFSLLLATMFEYPLAQTLLITILDFLMIAYLFIKKPFESTFDFAQQLFFEFIALFVNVTVSVNAVLDTGKYEAIGARKTIGKLIIYANLIFNFVTAIFMLITIGQILIDFYKGWKEKRMKKLRDLRIQTRVQELPAINNDISLLELQSLNQGRMTSNNSEIVSFKQESFDFQLLPNQKSKRPLNRPKETFNQESSDFQNPHQRIVFTKSRIRKERMTQRGQESGANSIFQQNKSKEN